MDELNFQRKRKRASHDSYEVSSAKEELESTEYKIALLASLFPYLQQDAIVETLLSHDGDLDKTQRTLNAPIRYKRGSSTILVGHQQQLSFFRPAVSSSANPVKKGQILHLYSSGDIARLTPCSIIHEFLPSQMAQDLLKELLVDVPSFKKERFKLFGNIVESPHTMAFYVNTTEEQQDYMRNYAYNGRQIEVLACLTARYGTDEIPRMCTWLASICTQLRLM